MQEKQKMSKLFKDFIKAMGIIMVIYIILLFFTVFLLSIIMYLHGLSHECKIEDILGDLPTWLAAMVAIFSVYYAKKAFDKQSEAIKSQEMAARRASFDATFTQIFAQHSVLYEKVQCSKDRCHFAEFSKYFKNNAPTSLTKIWNDYNEELEIKCGKNCSANFKNYFKYIYKEITYIRDNSYGILDETAQKQYVGLIEGQMNNDELFCYLVNQLEYYENHKEDDERRNLIDYFNYLKDNCFFKDICKESSGYRNLVLKALNKPNPKTIDADTLLVKREWF